MKTILKFVIFNAPRVGSNLLCTMLDSHPGILCHHEIFNPHVVGVARSLQENSNFHISTLEERERNPERTLEKVWKQNLGNPIVGFKLCWRQHDIYRHLLLDKSIRKIILKRRNRLQSYVSLLLARKTAKWVVYTDKPISTKKETVKVDLDDLWSVMEYNDAYYKELETEMQRTGQFWLDTAYEELFTPAGKSKILEFLEVPKADPETMRPGTVLLNGHSLRDLIENFEEVEAGLKGTELEQHLYTGRAIESNGN